MILDYLRSIFIDREAKPDPIEGESVDSLQIVSDSRRVSECPIGENELMEVLWDKYGKSNQHRPIEFRDTRGKTKGFACVHRGLEDLISEGTVSDIHLPSSNSGRMIRSLMVVNENFFSDLKHSSRNDVLVIPQMPVTLPQSSIQS